VSSTPSISIGSQAESFRKLVDAVFEDARAKAQVAIAKVSQESATILEESEKYTLKRSAETLSSYEEMVKIDARKEVFKAEIDNRMLLLKLKESWVDTVLEETRKKLQAFVTTPDYNLLILDELKSISKSVPVGQVQMNETDIARIGRESIRKVVGRDAKIEGHNLGTGGFIVITKDSKASVDRSIDSMLESEKQSLRGRIAESLFR
jgi:vacuolar-type H+-ATPase subunit E/Vma4